MSQRARSTHGKQPCGCPGPNLFRVGERLWQKRLQCRHSLRYGTCCVALATLSFLVPVAAQALMVDEIVKCIYMELIANNPANGVMNQPAHWNFVSRLYWLQWPSNILGNGTTASYESLANSKVLWDLNWIILLEFDCGNPFSLLPTHRCFYEATRINLPLVATYIINIINIIYRHRYIHTYIYIFIQICSYTL